MVHRRHRVLQRSATGRMRHARPLRAPRRAQRQVLAPGRGDDLHAQRHAAGAAPATSARHHRLAGRRSAASAGPSKAGTAARWPSISSHSVPISGALTGVAGASSTSHRSEQRLHLLAVEAAKALRLQVPVRRLQRAGDEAVDATAARSRRARVRSSGRCRLPPSACGDDEGGGARQRRSGHSTTSAAPSAAPRASTASRAGASALSWK